MTQGKTRALHKGQTTDALGPASSLFFRYIPLQSKVTLFLLSRSGGISYPNRMRRLNRGQHCFGMSLRNRCLGIPGPSKVRPHRRPSPQHDKVRKTLHGALTRVKNHILRFWSEVQNLIRAFKFELDNVGHLF